MLDLRCCRAPVPTFPRGTERLDGYCPIITRSSFLKPDTVEKSLSGRSIQSRHQCANGLLGSACRAFCSVFQGLLCWGKVLRSGRFRKKTARLRETTGSSRSGPIHRATSLPERGRKRSARWRGWKHWHALRPPKREGEAVSR